MLRISDGISGVFYTRKEFFRIYKFACKFSSEPKNANVLQTAPRSEPQGSGWASSDMRTEFIYWRVNCVQKILGTDKRCMQHYKFQ